MPVKEESKDERELAFESYDNSIGNWDCACVDHLGSRCGHLLYGVVGAPARITLLGISGDVGHGAG